MGPVVKVWDEMRLPADHPAYAAVGGENDQVCTDELVRNRTLAGICNDIFNPLMGSTGTEFSRNVQFEATFPRLSQTGLVRNRHSDKENGNRLSLLKPDPQLISRKLFTRGKATGNHQCTSDNDEDLPPTAQCDYLKAPFFNVLAAFWIQFVTHDWFSHTDEGSNERRLVSVGCTSDEARRLGCRETDRMEPSLYAQTSKPGEFTHEGETYMKRAPKTTSNRVTAWWDASQIYGFDDFIDQRLPADSNWRKHQEETVRILRDLYGTHICDESKIISETQFHVFIINASRRLFSDRFFTSSFRPEFYSNLGYDWIIHNGPLEECPYPLEKPGDGSSTCNEPVKSNNHKIQVSPLKRALMRNVPELRDELLHVVNAFDPWARDRGKYYSPEWVPRGDAVSDSAFDKR